MLRESEFFGNEFDVPCSVGGHTPSTGRQSQSIPNNQGEGSALLSHELPVGSRKPLLVILTSTIDKEPNTRESKAIILCPRSELELLGCKYVGTLRENLSLCM